ncbi:histidinol-phosphate transaminase [Hydrogenimonas cancrithermarum]|uniref:Histidinol-phosphate aminotransferase n=1 Tax=Hydrogenimonas cancrithermarum TaxID=2993563 RepID=A0ABN6WUB0_9BACT|nr:histidinol-phosphate transaminase [Hydrogenimonas cancrithermarum]BDY12582.1 histidinol-phosphate aminotransferase [Hydrogenimonas cancrithermarum]
MKFNPVIEHLKVYEPGKPIELVVREFGIDPKDIVKLASNENPHGCSRKAADAVRNAAHLMYRYPDDTMTALKTGLCDRFGIGSENLIVGAGSDQIIEFACHAKLYGGAKILQSEITFAMYQIYAAQCGAGVIKAPGIAHDLDAMYQLYKEHEPEIIFICAPNNPTGDCLNRVDIENFIERIDHDTLVIVDGAYQEYAAFKNPDKALDPARLIEKFPHVLYLGTFSKAYGLGGMRVGYGIGSVEIVRSLYKLRPPFNVTTLSLIAAEAALEDQAFVETSLADCFEQMARYREFATAHGIETIESYTNFITYLLDGVSDSTHIADALLRQGIIVRDLKGYGLNAIRITIGKADENSRFFDAMQKLIINSGNR